jgi:hypothetical protein
MSGAAGSQTQQLVERSGPWAAPRLLVRSRRQGGRARRPVQVPKGPSGRARETYTPAYDKRPYVLHKPVAAVRFDAAGPRN